MSTNMTKFSYKKEVNKKQLMEEVVKITDNIIEEAQNELYKYVEENSIKVVGQTDFNFKLVETKSPETFLIYAVAFVTYEDSK